MSFMLLIVVMLFCGDHPVEMIQRLLEHPGGLSGGRCAMLQDCFMKPITAKSFYTVLNAGHHPKTVNWKTSLEY